MTQQIFEKLAIPEGSRVVVTGVNGYVASHIANQLLNIGYDFIGSVRDLSKSQWMKGLFQTRYKKRNFELIEVKDAARSDAFDDAIRGISGVVHVATIFSNEPDMIENVITMNRNLLIAASKEPSVKRFVYTSSSEAAVFSSFLEHDEKHRTKITSDTWNEIAVERVRHQMSPATPKAGFDVYAASKTLGEQAIWDWVKMSKPNFVVNTGAYFANVEDVALLHVAGLINHNVQSERLFAFGKRFTLKEIAKIFQKNFPDRKFAIETVTNEDRTGNLDIGPADRAEQLLRLVGKPGWATLEDTMRENIKDLI